MSCASLRRVVAHRRGLTLVELVVVLAILVALAGILVPLLPGLIGRAETSARATNTGEIVKWIQTYEATNSRYPYDWDALVDATGTPPSYMNNAGFSVPSASSGYTIAALQVTPMTSGYASALSSAGITRVQVMSDAATGTLITYNPYPTAVTPPTDKVADGLVINPSGATTWPSLVTLSLAGQVQLNLADNMSAASPGVYVVFGFGKRCTLVGSGVEDAPVNFYDNFALSPDTRYSRYGVVFQVAGLDNTGSGTIITYSRAKLVRVFRFGSTLTTGDDALKSYWDDITTVSGS